MRLIWVRFALLRLLNSIFPPEKPTAAELLERIHELEAEVQHAREMITINTAPHLSVNSPPPQTTGPIQFLGARQRSFRRQLNMEPPGKLLKIDTDMRHRKQITRTLGPETVTGLQVVKPPHKVELRASDDDFRL